VLQAWVCLVMTIVLNRPLSADHKRLDSLIEENSIRAVAR
jgi:hypothetical protein